MLRGITLVLAIGCSGPIPIDGNSIRIDGRFEDWAALTPVAVDPAGDVTNPPADLGRAHASADGHFVHLAIEIGREANLQALDGSLELRLDADGDAVTGRTRDGQRGVDVTVVFSPPKEPGVAGNGTVLLGASSDSPISAYNAELEQAPTHSSDRFEIRMSRGAEVDAATRFLDGSRFRGRWVARALDGAIVDATPEFTVALPPMASGAGRTEPQNAAENDPLARVSSDGVRVVSWNVLYGGLLVRPEVSRKILRALDPDILLLQELTVDQTEAEVARFLDEALPGKSSWRVGLADRAGGKLRSGAATRLPADPADASRDRSLPAVIAKAGDARILALSVHLPCCGRLDDERDIARADAVEALRAAVRDRALAEGCDGVVLGGDLNLVGGAEPLYRLASGTDADGGDLAIADAYQLDGRSNATWSDARQPFMPGRLDYVLHSDRVFLTAETFVFDARDLSARWRKHHGLTADATATASDHLPVVVDLLPAPR